MIPCNSDDEVDDSWIYNAHKQLKHESTGLCIGNEVIVHCYFLHFMLLFIFRSQKLGQELRSCCRLWQCREDAEMGIPEEREEPLDTSPVLVMLHNLRSNLITAAAVAHRPTTKSMNRKLFDQFLQTRNLFLLEHWKSTNLNVERSNFTISMNDTQKQIKTYLYIKLFWKKSYDAV